MPANTILIITNQYDEHASHVIDTLNKRGASVFRLNTEDFPTKASLVSRNDGWTIKYHGRTLESQDVAACWYRRPVTAETDPSVTDPAYQGFITDECWFVLAGMYRCLSNVVWVSHPDALSAAKFKPRQLQLARQLGFKVPDTLITNDPEAFVEFYERHHGQVIVKIAGRGPTTIPADQAVYTNLVGQEMLAQADSVRLAPHLFQQYIAKQYEVRATIMGDQIFAVKIDSQSSEATETDWRRPGIEDVDHSIISLPKDVEQRCRALVDRLGLNFGAIDLIVTPEDEWIFLEINPNGQWLWLEELTDLPMTETLCDLLCGLGEQKK
jgi:glutathione synthase/RimK-type ligase-like ATP-grasp enzyme